MIEHDVTKKIMCRALEGRVLNIHFPPDGAQPHITFRIEGEDREVAFFATAEHLAFATSYWRETLCVLVVDGPLGGRAISLTTIRLRDEQDDRELVKHIFARWDGVLSNLAKGPGALDDD